MIRLNRHIRLGLFYFFLVALLGIFLRLFVLVDILANYRFIVHTHSHVALLGWVYIALTSLIYKFYLEKAAIERKYHRLFWATQACIAGMLLSFPFQGYALFSIIFSSLFLIATYFFLWFFLKNIPHSFRSRASFKCTRAALIYMVFSSIGPWALGAIISLLGKSSIWYRLAIYFYLHFQYNAWFLLALCGFLFYFLEENNFEVSLKDFRIFYYLINSGIIFSFFLSALWTKPPVFIYILAAIGAFLQIFGYYWLYRVISPVWCNFRKLFHPLEVVLMKLAGLFLMLKLLLQLLSATPYFADLAYTTPDFIIGYLHLTFLGVVSPAIFAFLRHSRLLKLSSGPTWLYFIAFVSTELLLFYKGMSIWLRLPLIENYFLILWIASLLFPVSVGWILIKNLGGRFPQR